MTEKQIASNLVDSDITCRKKAIELKNVAVHYNESKSFFKKETYTALKDISFDVYKGETLGIIGRNGAGKSTLLRLLAGIIKPDQGEVIHHCKSVSLMALAAGFDPNLSGRQNAVISGMLIGHSKKEMLSKLDEIKDFSELGDFFEKPVKNYSSGMRARLGFATAMHTHPDVLLIDEVLGVGDISFKDKAEMALQEKIDSDITVILVSHSEHHISRLARRVVWIDGGKVRLQDKSENVFPIYNLNVKFSTFGLYVKEYENDTFLDFTFEALKVVDGYLYFDCVVIDKKDRAITSLSIGSDHLMEGPKSTPGYGNRFKNITQAKNARYKNGRIKLGETEKIYINVNGAQHLALTINIDKLG